MTAFETTLDSKTSLRALSFDDWDLHSASPLTAIQLGQAGFHYFTVNNPECPAARMPLQSVLVHRKS
jgi:hypothetical protein